MVTTYVHSLQVPAAPGSTLQIQALAAQGSFQPAQVQACWVHMHIQLKNNNYLNWTWLFI